MPCGLMSPARLISTTSVLRSVGRCRRYPVKPAVPPPWPTTFPPSETSQPAPARLAAIGEECVAPHPLQGRLGQQSMLVQRHSKARHVVDAGEQAAGGPCRARSSGRWCAPVAIPEQMPLGNPAPIVCTTRSRIAHAQRRQYLLLQNPPVVHAGCMLYGQAEQDVVRIGIGVPRTGRKRQRPLGHLCEQSTGAGFVGINRRKFSSFR